MCLTYNIAFLGYLEHHESPISVAAAAGEALAAQSGSVALTRRERREAALPSTAQPSPARHRSDPRREARALRDATAGRVPYPALARTEDLRWQILLNGCIACRRILHNAAARHLPTPRRVRTRRHESCKTAFFISGDEQIKFPTDLKTLLQQVNLRKKKPTNRAHRTELNEENHFVSSKSEMQSIKFLRVPEGRSAGRI
ncbi:uncharacterized protein LOC126243480 [Schistocerca nitens]|uniref:uncharacterized protein LOC126243480 n=1 Tax=Schistocerca nitens TaxID=7011 RepID=UPI002117F618|nr:uncharacterized protein LOC126243480 [Schistocerca nitens]